MHKFLWGYLNIYFKFQADILKNTTAIAFVVPSVMVLFLVPAAPKASRRLVRNMKNDPEGNIPQKNVLICHISVVYFKNSSLSN